MKFNMTPYGDIQEVICSQCRPKYVYKDGKATDEQATDEDGLPIWRLYLMCVTDDEAGTFWVNYSSKEEPVVPGKVYGFIDALIGRLYGQRNDGITLTLDRKEARIVTFAEDAQN